jgi:hypothetical protein
LRINDKSKREKKEIREALRIRDGDGTRRGTRCFADGCMNEEQYRKQTGKDFDICHLDDNSSNWNMQNLFLATHKCNVLLTPHGKIDHEKRYTTLCNALKINRMKSLSTQVQINEEDLPRIRYAEFAKGFIADPIIDEELERIFSLHQEVEKKELINALVNISKLSPERIKPRLEGWCNDLNGHLKEREEIIDGKKEYYIRKREGTP